MVPPSLHFILAYEWDQVFLWITSYNLIYSAAKW